MTGNCRHCAFWKPPEGAWGSGDCRRKEPVAVDLGEGHIYTRWPKTPPTDWCGAYELRNGTDAAGGAVGQT